MPNVVLSPLKAHRKGQLEERLAVGRSWEEHGLVFTSPIGTPLEPRNVTQEFQ
jgi:integrase